MKTAFLVFAVVLFAAALFMAFSSPAILVITLFLGGALCLGVKAILDRLDLIVAKP